MIKIKLNNSNSSRSRTTTIGSLMDFELRRHLKLLYISQFPEVYPFDLVGSHLQSEVFMVPNPFDGIGDVLIGVDDLRDVQWSMLLVPSTDHDVCAITRGCVIIRVWGCWGYS